MKNYIISGYYKRKKFWITGEKVDTWSIRWVHTDDINEAVEWELSEAVLTVKQFREKGLDYEWTIKEVKHV